MSGGVYGGDDVGALVFDIGSYSTRTGYAGEDVPKFEIPSLVGVNTKKDENDKSKRSFLYGTNNLKVPIPGNEIFSLVKDGMIEDWDIFEETLNYIYKEQMKTEPELHPLLMTEPPWNTRSKREKLVEIMFEKYKIPAFYLAKNAVLSGFANGKSTCLVVDSGAIHTTVTPVYDGYCLLNSIMRTPLAGDFLTLQCKNLLTDKGIQIQPHFMNHISDKKKLDELSKSYQTFMMKEILQDFQASVLQVNETPLETRDLDAIPNIQYEFPNRMIKEFGIERFKIPEALFNPTQIIKQTSNNMLGIINAVTSSVGTCDIDLRQALYNNVIVVGGNTLIKGFVERLNHDLSCKTPSNVRSKLIYSNNSSERRFSSWIGGSILASLGTFQQLWISRQEYDESGRHIVDKKCL